MPEEKLLTKVRTYATSANIGPGYDCAGMALKICNDYEVYSSEKGCNCVNFNGSDIEGISKNDDNLVCITILKTLEKKYGADFKQYQKMISLKCTIKVPVERGLGSSSTAVAAGLLIANKIYDLNYSLKELFNIGLEIEPHPDNLAPCLAGGFVVSYKNSEGKYDFKKINIKKKFKVLLAVPDLKVNTNEARKLVPESFPKEDVIFNMANFAILTECLISGEINRLHEFISDKLHQPYRRSIYPQSMAIVDVLCRNYKIGAAISGSGSTAAAFISLERLSELEESILPDIKKKYPGFEFYITEISDKGSYCF